LLKTILAVIVGYVAMAVVVFVVFTGLYAAMGADRAFQPGTYDPSALWIICSLLVSLFAAVVGGMVAARMGGRSAAKALAILVVVLGVGLAWPAINAPADTLPAIRAGDVPNMEAMRNTRQPAWVALALPFVGAAGVMIGGARRRSP
jgi:hypothetical protein